MTRPTSPAATEERRLNEMLRRVDWRFLLRRTEEPRVLDMTSDGLAEPLRLAFASAGADGSADLAVLGFPHRRALRRARGALGSAGEVACIWRAPRPAAMRRARARLRRAGFTDFRPYRPGPDPRRRTAMWLPIDAPETVARALAERPPRSLREAILRRVWRRFGPVYLLARKRGGEPPAGAGALPGPDSRLLLTGGAGSEAKVVGVSCSTAGEPQPTVAKFGRTAAAGRALEREADLLDRLCAERPGLGGIPRTRARGRRVGHVAILQEAIHGQALDTLLGSRSFATVAARVTRWLADLAGTPRAQPASAWSERLVLAPLAELEGRLGSALGSDLADRARGALAGLGDLPLVWEHRDLGPWNVFIGPEDSVGVIDWEDAEPLGLPLLDLNYFLASAAFTLAGGSTGPDRAGAAREANRRLLDPLTRPGQTAADCVSEYCRELGIGAEDVGRLRLLCWLTQATVASRRTAAPDLPGSDLEVFLALAGDELERLETTT